MRVVKAKCPHLTEITFLYDDQSTGPHNCGCNDPTEILHVYGVLLELGIEDHAVLNNFEVHR
jgi:hypothetical protein